VAAFSSQQKVTDQRDIVIKLDRFPAIRTPRTGKNDGLPLRHPEDANIEKTADQCSKNDGNNSQHS